MKGYEVTITETLQKIVAGTFFICGAEGEDFTSLPEEFRKKYADRFRSPETFLKMGRGIMAVHMEPKPPASREGKKSPGMEL